MNVQQPPNELREFFTAQQQNLANAVRFEPFGVLLSIVDQLYRRAIGLISANDLNAIFFGRFVLMEHKAFLTAASLIGQAQPDDAATIMRRSVEMARVAAAFKERPQNIDRWMAFEERHMRWLDRQQGKKPKPLKIHLRVTHPVARGLEQHLGILSDAGAHFTPEYFATLKWEERDGMLRLQYFTGDQQSIEREVLYLTAIQGQILQVLDFCLDGRLRADAQWQQWLAVLTEQGRRFNRQYQERYGVPASGFETAAEGAEEQ